MELTAASENEPKMVAALDAAEDCRGRGQERRSTRPRQPSGQVRLRSIAGLQGLRRCGSHSTMRAFSCRRRAPRRTLWCHRHIWPTLIDVDQRLGTGLRGRCRGRDGGGHRPGRHRLRSKRLRKLAAADASGAVLALGAPTNPITPPLVGSPASGTTYVRRRPMSKSLLDRLVGSAVVVDGDWTTAVDTALAYPDVVVVTQNGDRCGLRADGASALPAVRCNGCGFRGSRERGH